MGNCLVTKLKESVNNNNLLKQGEIACIVNTLDVSDAKMRMYYNDGLSHTIRALYNAELSLDGVNWSTSISNVPDQYGEIEFYVNTNGAEGVIAASDKYNATQIFSLVSDIYIKREIDNYAKQEILKDYVVGTDIQPLELSEYPKIQLVSYLSNYLNTNSGKYIFEVSYDKSKQTTQRNYVELSGVYFNAVSQLVDFLEDAIQGQYVRVVGDSNIRYKDNDNVPLNDSRISEYSQRLYNCIVTILNTLGSEFALFGYRYTYSNGTLYANGEPVII